MSACEQLAGSLLRQHLPCGQPPDSEVSDKQREFVAFLATHEDVRRLQVTMDQRRIQPMCIGDDRGQPMNNPAREAGVSLPRSCISRMSPARSPPSMYSYSRQGGSADKYVCRKATIPRPSASLPHHLVEDDSLVSEEPVLRGRVEAKLQSDRRHGIEMRVASFPHLPEATLAKQFDEFPINVREWSVPRLEPRKAVRQEADKIFRFLQGQAGGKRRAGRIGEPTQRLADGGWQLIQVGHQRQTDF